MEDRVITYAQNREDMILAAFFPDKKDGFYVDIGASHPVVSSVTKHFYELGWHGINIEPNRKHYLLLSEDRPRDININVGISDKKGKMIFREYEGYGLSTFSEAIKKEHETESGSLTDNYKDYEVVVTTLRDVFKEHHVRKINFLKIDIEGLEYEALVSNDWSQYRPEVICIESNHIIKDWRPLLEENKYIKFFYDGLNDYYVAKECYNRFTEDFAFEETLLLGKPIVSLYWHQQMGLMEQRRLRAEHELQFERGRISDAQIEIAHLRAELENQRRIRNLIKTLLRKIDLSIRLHIEDLNKPKKKRVSKKIMINQSEIQAGSSSPEQILSLVRKNDFDNFYRKTRSGTYSKTYSYRITSSIYEFCRGIMKFIYHALRSLARKVRRSK